MFHRSASTLRYLLLLLLVLATGSARAQTSVYATAGFARYGFTHLNYGGSDDISFKKLTAGVTGGAFYNFPIQSRVTVGVDGRFGYSPGYNGGAYGGAALRVGFVPHRNPLRPYLQIGGGVVHSGFHQTVSSNATVTQSYTSGAAQFLVGLDVRLNDHYDLRVPEYGAEAGGGNGVHTGTSFLQVGVVYHLQAVR